MRLFALDIPDAHVGTAIYGGLSFRKNWPSTTDWRNSGGVMNPMQTPIFTPNLQDSPTHAFGRCISLSVSSTRARRCAGAKS
jgi:hypothetical protein